MHPEALILRRCYPVPVTFADLRAAYQSRRCASCGGRGSVGRKTTHGEGVCKSCEGVGFGGACVFVSRKAWSFALKQVTSALDEVYAVVDGREVRVATMDCGNFNLLTDDGWRMRRVLESLQEVADEQGYWERSHDVRLDLSPRPVSHEEVARAVLVGQEYVERGLTKVGYDDEMFDATRR